MKEVKNQNVYRMLLEPGDRVYFSCGQSAKGEQPLIRSAIVKGWSKDGGQILDADGRKVDTQSMLVDNVEGTEVSRFLYGDETFYEGDGVMSLEDLIRERASTFNPKGVNFLQQVRNKIEREKNIGAGALTFAFENVNPFVDLSVDKILEIWTKASDKQAVEALFEALVRISFTEWLVESFLEAVKPTKEGV